MPGAYMSYQATHHLLLSCPLTVDHMLVTLVEQLRHQAIHVLSIEQQRLGEEATLFARLEMMTTLPDEHLRSVLNAIDDRYQLDWQLFPVDTPKRMAVLVSRHTHVLQHLLDKWQQGQLNVELHSIISNHAEVEHVLRQYSKEIPFHHVSVTPYQRLVAESDIVRRLEPAPDIIVLARYMQILSADFIRRFSMRIINIHHSSLPAFVGANPYQQAYEKGVKLIGATAHYATEILDQGPIIEQETLRVSHRYSVHELKELGSDLERSVMSRALRWHLENRIMVHGQRTVVFYR